MTFLKRITGFFRETWQSCYDMEYYRGVRTGTLGKSFGYAASFHLLLVLLTAALLAPTVFGLKSRLIDAAAKHVPEGAEISVAKGKFATTLPMPYEFTEDGTVFTVDTSHEGMSFPEKLKEKEGLFVGRDAIFVREVGTSGGFKDNTVPFKDAPDFTLTKADGLAWIGKWLTPIIALLGLASIGFFWALFMGWTMLTVALYSLIAMLAGKVGKVNLRYGQWYAVGLHAVTLPVFVSTVLAAMNIRLPFLHFALYFLLVYAVIVDERNNPTSGAPVAVAPAADVPPAAPTEPPAETPKPPVEPPHTPPTTE